MTKIQKRLLSMILLMLLIICENLILISFRYQSFNHFTLKSVVFPHIMLNNRA